MVSTKHSEDGRGDQRTVSYPKQAPSPKMRKKSASGKNGPAPVFPMAPRLLSSLSAKITNMSNVAVMNSEKNWFVLVKKALPRRIS